MNSASELKEPGTRSVGVNLRDWALIFYKGRKTIAVCIVVWLVIGIARLHFVSYGYVAQMQVTSARPADDGSSSRLGSFGGLASLAGVNLPSNQSAAQFRLYLDSLGSRDVAAEMAKNQTLMKALFWNEWNEESHSWQRPKVGLMGWINGGMRALLGLPEVAWEPPNAARLQQFLKYSIKIEQDPRKTYLATISFVSGDSNFSIYVLNELNTSADNHLRQKALQRAERYIDYLSNKLNTVTVAEHREAIMQALSEQEKYAMSAGSASPFAADFFDKPSASLEPNAPKPTAVLLKLILVGGCIGAVLVLLLHYFGDVISKQIHQRVKPEKLPRFLRHQSGG